MAEIDLPVADRNFWREPRVWKVGEGYVPTEAVLKQAVYAGVALAGAVMVGVEFLRVGSPEEILRVLPAVIPVAVAQMGMQLEIIRDGRYWAFSRKVKEAKAVTSHQTAVLRQKYFGDDGDMLEAEITGDQKRVDQLIQERRSLDKELVTFGKRVLRREGMKKDKS